MTAPAGVTLGTDGVSGVSDALGAGTVGAAGVVDSFGAGVEVAAGAAAGAPFTSDKSNIIKKKCNSSIN
jgi:hypothetical protein